MSDAQRRVAHAYIAQLDRAKVFRKPIATRVDAFPAFNPVDLSQQDFMLKNPRLDYPSARKAPAFMPEMDSARARRLDGAAAV